MKRSEIYDPKWPALEKAQFKIFSKGTNMKAKKTAKRIKAKTMQAASPSVKVYEWVKNENPDPIPPTHTEAISSWAPLSAIKAPGLYVMRNSNNGEVCYSIARILGIDRGFGQFFRVEGVHTCISQNSVFQAIKE